MPSLFELTDAYMPQETIDSLPVEKSFPELKRVIIDTTPKKKEEVKADETSIEGDTTTKSNSVIERITKRLLGLEGEERYQLWPEKVIREALTGAGDVATGKVPTMAIDPVTGDVHTSPQMIEKAQAISALAGSGGLAGVTDATLGATPFLRPALKYKDKLYKGKEGQQHLDVIPEKLYGDFQKKAMSGDDIAEYNFGFVNDKGHFLNREDALKYGIDTGLIDPQAGKFGALTSTLMADSTKPGVAIEAVAKTASPFFSAVEHNVAAIPQAKMTGEQWLGTLSNKPGVKPEEMEWTGLRSFLEENKGKPVTKAQIEEHLASNKVELKEVNKGENLTPKQMFENNSNKKWESLTSEEQKIYSDNIGNSSNTKYHSYQLPGGKNYREMLLTLPVNQPKLHTDYLDKLTSKYGVGRDKLESVVTLEEAAKVQSLSDKSLASNSQYRSSHWGEPNILAHVRMNDRTIDGKKSLHLEEIQSDWHQQGRDKGYKLNDKEYKKVENDYQKALKDRNEFAFNSDEYKAGTQKVEELGKQLRNSRDAIPDAPFKKSWHELALKRMLREAAEKGYDRLSWTPGEAQAARYDLSKQIDNIKWSPEGKRLEAFKDGRSVMVHSDVTPDKLPDLIGKEAADKLINKPTKVTDLGKAKLHDLSGVDLKIGGEGMKGFYDQIIPKALEKLGKEHGVKVKSGEIEGIPGGPKEYGDVLDRKENPSFKMNKVYYIDIPQSLRDTAIGKGFPLFSNKYMFVPVDYEPDFGGK